jgi:hypothetical protein
MKRIVVAAAAALALLSSSAYTKPASAVVDAALSGISQGTPEGRELSAELLYYNVSCPLKLPPRIRDVFLNIMLENGGLEGAKSSTPKVAAEFKAVGREKWCARVLNMLQRIEDAASGGLNSTLE